jgi:hypothetical protein
MSAIMAGAQPLEGVSVPDNNARQRAIDRLQPKRGL